MIAGSEAEGLLVTGPEATARITVTDTRAIATDSTTYIQMLKSKHWALPYTWGGGSEGRSSSSREKGGGSKN